VGTKPTFYWRPTTRLTGPISLAWDRYIQYFLVGANPLVLNRHRRGLQPWKCRLSYRTPWPSQPMVLHFPPKGSARSQVIQSQHKPQVKVMWNTYHRPVIFQPLGIYRSLYLRLVIANVFQILVRSSRVTWKVLIMQLRFQSTPINLMHNHS
jgi:hypothetical protein